MTAFGIIMLAIAAVWAVSRYHLNPPSPSILPERAGAAGTVDREGMARLELEAARKGCLASRREKGLASVPSRGLSLP